MPWPRKVDWIIMGNDNIRTQNWLRVITTWNVFIFRWNTVLDILKHFCLMRLNQHSIDAMHNIFVRSTSILLKKWMVRPLMSIKSMGSIRSRRMAICPGQIPQYFFHWTLWTIFRPDIYFISVSVMLVMDSSLPKRICVYWPGETKCDDGS